MKLPRVREEREVHRVHHQLDAHEDGDSVLAGEHAADAEREENRAEDQEVVRRDHCWTSRRGAMLRALRRSAPTIAASSRIDTASKGKRYDSKSAMPIA